MTTPLYIGALAACTGLPRSTIRYYESIGLLPAATRTPSGYRVYSRKAVAELDFVRRSQALGFSLEDIRELLSLHRRGVSPCRRVIAIARQRLEILGSALAARDRGNASPSAQDAVAVGRRRSGGHRG